MGLGELEEYFKLSKVRKIVIDTHKFLGWMRANNLGINSQLLLKKLMGKIVEVHFRFKSNEDIRSLFIGPDINSIKTMKQLIKLGYQGRIIVEAGWPDAGEVANFWQVDMIKTRKIHVQVVKFLKNL